MLLWIVIRWFATNSPNLQLFKFKIYNSIVLWKFSLLENEENSLTLNTIAKLITNDNEINEPHILHMFVYVILVVGLTVSSY